MTEEPPERRRRSDRTLRRLEKHLAAAMAFVFIALWLLGDRSMGQLQSMDARVLGPPISGGWLVVGLLLALIVINAALVAAETAVDMLRPIHVKHVKEGNQRQSRRLQKLMDGKLRYVAACALASQTARLAMVIAGLMLAPSLAQLLEERAGWDFNYGTILAAAILIAIPVLLINLIFELVPKSYASLHPHQVALRAYRFVQGVSFVFSAPVKLVTVVATLFTARFGGKASFAIANQAEEEIKNLVESAQETGEIEVDEKELLHSVFEFTDTIAREVMTPRVDLDAMPIDSPPQEVVRVIQESGHSRIPLYEDTDDQIVGIIHAKDLLMEMVANPDRVNLRSLIRPALFVPENKNLHELLAEMRASRSQMAVVQDEFGGTAGIATIEDIVEELVGDIVDEYDVEEPEIVEVPEGILVDGKTHVDDVNAVLGSNFDSQEFDTIGGFVFGLFGRQPRPDETMPLNGYIFRIAETDGRRIVRLLIERAPALTEVEALDAIEEG